MFNSMKRFMIIFLSSTLMIILLINFSSYFGMYGQDTNTYVGFTSFISFLKNEYTQKLIDSFNNIFTASFNLAESLTLHITESSESIDILRFIMDIVGFNAFRALWEIIYNLVYCLIAVVNLVYLGLTGFFSMELPPSTYRIMLTM